jgi:hypothetical protein
MAIIDDLMKKTEEGLKTLKETAQDIAFNVEKQAKISKRKFIDITKVQRNIQKLYIEMGEYVYEELSSGKTLSKDDPFLRERVSGISEMKIEINEIEDEIDAIQHMQPPKHDEE